MTILTGRGDADRPAGPWTTVRMMWHAAPGVTVALWSAAILGALAQVAVLIGFAQLTQHAVEPGRPVLAGFSASALAALGAAAALFVTATVLPAVVTALGSVARSVVRLDIDRQLLQALMRPNGIAHLEDPNARNRLASASGGASRVPIGDAAVLWVSIVSARLSGYLACAVIALHVWWMGLTLLALWLALRRLIRASFLDQAVRQYRETTARRRALYLASILSRPRDAKEVRVFNLANFVTRKFRRNQRRATAAGMPAVWSVHRRAAYGGVLVLITYFVLGALLVHRAQEPAGLRSAIVVFLLLTLTVAVGTVSWNDVMLGHGLTSIPDIERITSLRGPDVSGARSIPSDWREVRLEHVAFGYPDQARPVLTNVCLTLPCGQSTALVGVNGSGKTTIVSMLMGLRMPAAGAITVDGASLTDAVIPQWQRQIAVVTQRPARYPTTLRANVTLGAPAHHDDLDGVAEALLRTRLDTLVAALPDGWDTLLDRTLPGGVDLSGGQWQRLALARALFAIRHGARLLVLDEPTAAMDVENEARFNAEFFDLTAGITTLVISHRYSTIRQADRIYVLDDGKVSQQGNHDDLMAAGSGLYFRAFSAQAEQFA